MVFASRVSTVKFSWAFDQGRFIRDAITVFSGVSIVLTEAGLYRGPTTDLRPGGPHLQQIDERVLSFVRLLIAGAHQVFHSNGGFFPLALFKFCDPGGHRIHDVAGSLADSLRLVTLAVNALGTFDYFYFFLGHKHIRRAGLQSG